MSDEKKCPYCAETIKVEAIKCRYCKADLTMLTQGEQIPSGEVKTPKVASCQKCNVALISVEKKSSVSGIGLLSVFIFLIGLAIAFFNVVIGVLIMILALMIGNSGGNKKTVMVCPQCGTQGTVL